MRLRKRDLVTAYLKNRLTNTQDAEGNFVEGFANEATKLAMNVQSASGQVMASIYGQSLPYIKSCKYQGDAIKEGVNEKDGVCLFVDRSKDPDYEIIAIQSFSTHKNITLKKLGV